MPDRNRLDINLLGTSFTIRSHEDQAYLKRVLSYLEKQITKTKQSNPVADPVKISILTSLYLIDELFREKHKDGNWNLEMEEESEEMERITMRLITELDEAIGD